MTRIKITPYLIGLAILIFASSCYEETYIDERDITLTHYDTECDFTQYKTFIIRDSIGIITDHLTDAQIEIFYSKGGFNDITRAKIISELTSIGYTQVDSLKDADMAVNMALAVIENTGTIIYPGYWWDYYYYGYWGWYGSYYPQWGAYYNYWYPWYPSYSYSYSYDVGTLLIEFVDGESLQDYREYMNSHTKDETEKTDPLDPDAPALEFLWQSVVRGVLSSSTEHNESRVHSGIEDAFTQSPYLNK